MTSRIKRWSPIAVLAAALLALGLFQATASTATSTQPDGTRSAVARTGHISAGRVVRVPLSRTPFTPTKAQLAKRAADMQRLDNLAKAPVGPHPSKQSIAQLKGSQTSPTVAQAPGDFKIYKNAPIPKSCATSCAQSTVNEPDTANSGRFIEQTSNWDMAYSSTGGAATPIWSYQNPYALDPSFCCDQTITSVPSRNRFIYEGLDLGTGSQTGFDIGVTKTQSPTSWCVYHFTGGSFGGTVGDVTDYPKIAYANNNLYVTWNEYDSSGSSWLFTGLARFPLDSLASCSGFGFNFLTRTDNFTFGLSQGSLDTFYWVSNWYTQAGGSGTSERIYNWPEGSGTYFFNDVGVTSYNFSGGSCASQDGVVTDWCTRLDPRWETASISRAEYNANANAAFAGDNILTVTITAGPGGGDPFPYVIYEYFKLNAKSFIQTAATFNDGFAFAYGACSPNAHGYLGCVASWGGGTGTSHFFPGGIVILQDVYAQAQPWSFSFNVNGAGNASAWGDYMVTQPFQPDQGGFLTTEWHVTSGGLVAPQVVVFGRSADFNGYSRWANT